jgi:hypothetical protein
MTQTATKLVQQPKTNITQLRVVTGTRSDNVAVNRAD